MTGVKDWMERVWYDCIDGSNRYLPPYTTFLPVRKEEDDAKRKRKSAVECLVFSQLSYLAIFIILVCMTESKSLKEDPLNFNVLSITLEVIRQGTLNFLSFCNILRWINHFLTKHVCLQCLWERRVLHGIQLRKEIERRWYMQRFMGWIFWKME